MSKEFVVNYHMITENGFEKAEVRASQAVHDQLRAIIQAGKHLSGMVADARSAQIHARELEAHITNTIEKTQLSAVDFGEGMFTKEPTE